MTRRDSIWKSLDWVTIVVYLLLIVFGWFSVCGASYDYGDRDFLDFSTRAGKQFVWIICSFGLGFVLLMLDDSLYDMFSYLIYIGLMLLLIVTIFIAPDTKGSRSWLILGPVSLQPAEFAKFATALALAKYMSAYSFTMKNWKSSLMLAFLIPEYYRRFAGSAARGLSDFGIRGTLQLGVGAVGALCTCCRVSCLSFFKRAPFILFSDWAVCFGFDRFPLLQRLLLQ